MVAALLAQEGSTHSLSSSMAHHSQNTGGSCLPGGDNTYKQLGVDSVPLAAQLDDPYNGNDTFAVSAFQIGTSGIGYWSQPVKNTLLR